MKKLKVRNFWKQPESPWPCQSDKWSQSNSAQSQKICNTRYYNTRTYYTRRTMCHARI